MHRFIRYESKKLLFGPSSQATLPEDSYACLIQSHSGQTLVVHDDECSIRCKLPAEAQNLLIKYVMHHNQEITSFAGVRIVLKRVKVKFSI